MPAMITGTVASEAHSRPCGTSPPMPGKIATSPVTMAIAAAPGTTDDSTALVASEPVSSGRRPANVAVAGAKPSAASDAVMMATVVRKAICPRPVAFSVRAMTSTLPSDSTDAPTVVA